MAPVNIFWFRRDLRLNDNRGLYHALRSGLPVVPLFIFDTNILKQLEKKDARVEFIHQAITKMQDELDGMGSTMEIIHATPSEAFEKILEKYNVSKVFTNHDYEPYARERDDAVKKLLASKNVEFLSFKDQVIFEKDEVVKDDGSPYTVFTPYSRKWKSLLKPVDLQSYNIDELKDNFFKQSQLPVPSLEELGFEKTNIDFPPATPEQELVKHYAQDRNFPGKDGTSRLGVHLRFGTVSIRQLARFAQALSETFLNELIWREFYQAILWHFPQVGQGKSFKPAYDNIEWRRDEGEFEKWCKGGTGYPIVDAGMRELNATGFMHNRVRMITASFLCKHLLLDWRLGEAYFAEKLLDYDLASNNGGWQWSSGSGCDSAPYFRIFNPALQTKKFDPDLTYIKKWVAEFKEFSYPPPVVDHELARKRCLEVYSRGLSKK